MKLTHEQIAAARKCLSVTQTRLEDEMNEALAAGAEHEDEVVREDFFADARDVKVEADAMRSGEEALDAYERVEALLNECEARERELAAEHPEAWKMLTEAKTRLLTTGKLRRALYGEVEE